MLPGALFFLCGALGEQLRLVSFSSALLGVALLRSLLRGADARAESPVLGGALGLRRLVVEDVARREARAVAGFMGDGAFVERVDLGGRAAFADLANDGALPRIVMAPRDWRS